MTTNENQSPTTKLGYVVAELVLVAGIVATLWLTANAWRDMKARDAERFRYEASQLVQKLDTGLRAHGAVFMAMRDWFTAHNPMTESEWTNHAYRIEIIRLYPGLLDFGFVEYVSDTTHSWKADEQSPVLKAHIERMRARLGTNYTLELPSVGVKNFSWFQMPVVWHSYAQWRGRAGPSIPALRVGPQPKPRPVGDDELGLRTGQSGALGQATDRSR